MLNAVLLSQMLWTVNIKIMFTPIHVFLHPNIVVFIYILLVSVMSFENLWCLTVNYKVYRLGRPGAWKETKHNIRKPQIATVSHTS